jgi:elongation factor G
MAFKLAGAIAMREAMADAQPVLLEPIMLVSVSCPDSAVGDVIGDLNGRRGHPLGVESGVGGFTDVRAEAPMSELLAYAPDLRSITGGQGEYTLELLRYEEVPGHLAGRVATLATA